MKTRQDSLYRCQFICKGSEYYSASKEDRIIVIPDLIEYINENYTAYSRNFYEEKTLYSKEQLLSENENLNIKLYAVFDGHCGSFCSTYLQQMFPYELCANISFKQGEYTKALKETYTNLHKKLLECKNYKPEEQTYIYCSGSTASVALITEETTYFSFLGDSPIIIWKNQEEKPKMLFQEHNIENTSLHQQLIDSNIFLVLSQPQNHKPLSKIITEQDEKQKILEKFNTDNLPKKYQKNHRSNKSRKNDLKSEHVRIGFSALNVWGTIGDSIYEPTIFNTFVKEIETFRTLRRERLNQLTIQLKLKQTPLVRTRSINAMDIDPVENEEDEPSLIQTNNNLISKKKVLVQSSILQYFNSPSSISENKNTPNYSSNHRDNKEEIISKNGNSTQNQNINAMKQKNNIMVVSDNNLQLFSPPTTTFLSEFKFEFEKNPDISLKELHNLSNQFSYEEIISFLISRPNWSLLSKHITLSKKNLSTSKLFSSTINILNKENFIRDCSLKRIPEITSIKNSELRLFIIASDGVIRSYDDYKDKYQSMIINNIKSPEKLMGAFKEFSSSINDDHSFISLFYNK